jgi:hypothetical protein
MEEFVQEMHESDPVNLGFLAASGTEILSGSERCATVQAVGPFHVTG